MRQVRRNTFEIMRDEMIVRDKIRSILADGPCTIPTIAEALGAPTEEVLLWVMGMRRYGALEEIGRADENGYFKYAIATKEDA